MLNKEHALAKLIHEYDRNVFLNGIANNDYKFKDDEITLNHTACLIISIDHNHDEPKAAKLSANHRTLVGKHTEAKMTD